MRNIVYKPSGRNWPIVLGTIMALVVYVLILVLVASCRAPTETPTISPPATPTPISPLPTPTLVSPLSSPTPESPLPTPPVSPLQVPEAEAEPILYSVWGDVIKHCIHTGITPTLKIAAKWVELDTGQLVFSATLDTGEVAPAAADTEQFDGDFRFDYPVHERDVGEWAKGWWSIDDGSPWHCYDEWGSLVEVDEVAVPWFEGGSQDAEGYWFVREVAGVTPTPTPTATPIPECHIYCPLSLRGEVPTGVTPTPTPTPDADGSGGVGRALAWALVGMAGLILLGFFVWQIYLYLARRGKGKV